MGRAYETLKDDTQRRAYDLIYPSIAGTTAPKTANDVPKSRPTPNAKASSASETLKDRALIAELEKCKQTRAEQWRARKSVYESKIFEINRSTRRIEQEIKNLAEIARAEAAEEAQKNSWGTWLMSPFYKKIEETDEEKARKEIARQERRLEKDMKERRLESVQKDLKIQQTLLSKGQEQFDASNAEDDRKIRALQTNIVMRENQERWERERVEGEKRERERLERERLARLERERQAKIRKQQQEEAERKAREEMEAWRKQWEDQLSAEQKRRREAQEHRERMYTHSQTRSSPWLDPDDPITACSHDGWWPKVQGRRGCPECGEIWTYLLECPGCQKKACPRCQSVLRPRWRRH